MLPKTMMSLGEEIHDWIQNDLTPDNITGFSKTFVFSCSPSSLQGLYLQYIFKLQDHLEVMNKNLRNMFKNYLCFEVEADKFQMKRFQENIYQECHQKWVEYESNLGELTQGHDFITDAFQKLSSFYEVSNNDIIASETKIMKNVWEKLVEEYDKKLLQFKMDHINLESEAEIVQHQLQKINNRLTLYFLGILSRALDYDGKFNNVVKSQTDKALQVLQTHFKVFSNEIFTAERSTDADVIQKYIQGLKADEAFIESNFDSNKLLRLHDSLAGKLTSNKQSTQSKDLKTRLNNIFSSIYEKRFLAVEIERPSACSTPNMIIFHVSMNKIRVYSIKNGRFDLIFFENYSGEITKNLPSYIGLTKEGSGKAGFHAAQLNQQKNYLKHSGKLLEYFMKENTNIVSKEICVMLKTLFYGVRKFAEKQKDVQQYFRIAVIIPTWVSPSYKVIVRQACYNSGFTCNNINIVNESYLVAYYAMKNNQGGSDESYALLVVIREHEVGIEVLKLSCKGNRVVQLALAYEQWEPLRYTRTNHKFVASAQHIEATKTAMERALSQLHTYQEENISRFVVVSENPEWETMLDSFVTATLNVEKLRRLTSNDLSLILRPFCSDSSSLMKFLLIFSGSHLVHDNSNLAPKQYNTTENPSIALKKSKELLEKCARMEQQIENGQVSIGSLSKKIVLETIANAKLAAMENMAHGEMEEIDKLFKKHKFH